MAHTIPNYIPSKASQGEITLFGRLRNGLPDDFIVWYEPVINNKYPDFIILGPTFGLLVIEVKGWSCHQIERADRNTFDIRRIYDGKVKVETENTPLRQARNYLYTITDRLKEHSILCHPGGAHKGKLVY